MSHYLKTTMDCIFGEENFRNEIVWCYAGGGIPRLDFPRKHDVILRYGKSERVFNVERKSYGSHAESGRRATDLGGTRSVAYNPEGTPINDWWVDITPLINWHKERTGYPTQKPLALLERIIKASSNEGDIVLDPFCGCATTCVAAEQISRKWIGIDVSSKAYDLVKERLDKEVARPDELPHYRQDVHLQARPPKRTDVEAGYREEKYVYVISHPNYEGEYKVGIAKDVNARLNSYQIGDPERSYSLQYSLKTPLFRETENHIHKVFPNKHEWVRASLEDIKREMHSYLSY